MWKGSIFRRERGRRGVAGGVGALVFFLAGALIPPPGSVWLVVAVCLFVIDKVVAVDDIVVLDRPRSEEVLCMRPELFFFWALRRVHRFWDPEVATKQWQVWS